MNASLGIVKISKRSGQCITFWIELTTDTANTTVLTTGAEGTRGTSYAL